MSFDKELLDFGSGSFVGGTLKNPSFSDLPIQEQAKAIGWAVGCPVVEELTDPNNPNPGRGPEAMLYRYAEVGFWFGHINREAQVNNPDLYAQLIRGISRRPEEPVGKHEPQSVPENYLAEIPPTETLVGYAMPRLFIKQLGDKGLSQSEKQEKLMTGLGIIKTNARIARTPEEYLALTAEAITGAGMDPLDTLSTILSKGWYNEHNADHMVTAFKDALEAKAPNLWVAYSGLSVEDKAALKII